MAQRDRARVEDRQRRTAAPRKTPTPESTTVMKPKRDAIDRLAKRILGNAGPAPVICLGPIVWNIEPGDDTRHWYFMIIAIGAAGDPHVYGQSFLYDRDLA